MLGERGAPGVRLLALHARDGTGLRSRRAAALSVFGAPPRLARLADAKYIDGLPRRPRYPFHLDAAERLAGDTG